jgi:hypothetical protein
MKRNVIDQKFKDMAVKAAEWVSTPEGQGAADRAVKNARETVQTTLDAQKLNDVEEERIRFCAEINRLNRELDGVTNEAQT